MKKGGSVFAPAIVILSLAFSVKKVETVTPIAIRLCENIEIFYLFSTVCRYQFGH